MGKYDDLIERLSRPIKFTRDQREITKAVSMLIRQYIDRNNEAAEALRSLQKQNAEYDKAIGRFIEGDYPHPRSYRPQDCPHGIRYWQDCSECDVAFLESERKRIKEIT